MIDSREIAEVACRFGVPEIQVVRDHFISHVLAAIADWPTREEVTFFGGTALCRTWLPDSRLSEDIDLIVESASDGESLRQHIPRRLRREYPTTEWSRLDSKHQVETLVIATRDLRLKVQLAQWRTERRAIPIVNAPVRLR